MTKIIQRNDTSTNWATANPVLATGEVGWESDTKKFKLGDGVTAWNSLAYASSAGGSSTPENMVTTDTEQEITGSKLFSNGLKVGGYDGISDNNGEPFIYVDPSHNGWTIGSQNSGGWFENVHIKRGSSGDYVNIDSGNISEYLSGAAPSNMVTTDTEQTISGTKTFETNSFISDVITVKDTQNTSSTKISPASISTPNLYLQNSLNVNQGIINLGDYTQASGQGVMARVKKEDSTANIPLVQLIGHEYYQQLRIGSNDLKSITFGINPVVENPTVGEDPYDVLSTANAFKQVKLTQAEYDALVTKDENTMYIIVE